jgi:hypothetical protein
LQWFLDREVRAGVPSGSAAAVGTVVHTLAEALARDEIPPDPDVLNSWLEEVWPHLGMPVQWYAVSQRTQVREALVRLCNYHRSASGNVVGVEVALNGDIDLVQLADVLGVDLPEHMRDGDPAISVTGRIDRIEQDESGVLTLVDFKTSRSLPSKADVHDHLQLGLYQAAVLARAITGALGTDPASEDSVEQADNGRDLPPVAGAALVELMHELKKDPGQPRVLAQPSLLSHESPVWFIDAVTDAVDTVRKENFSPRPGKHCKHCAFTRLCPSQCDGEEVATWQT